MTFKVHCDTVQRNNFLSFVFILSLHVRVLLDHHQVIYGCNEIVKLYKGSRVLDFYFDFSCCGRRFYSTLFCQLSFDERCMLR
jgi:hypothetical protein